VTSSGFGTTELDRGEGPGWRENVIQRFAHRAKSGCVDRGTGAVTATGSYEGSLSMEGTSGRQRPSDFHESAATMTSAFLSVFRSTCSAPRRQAWLARTKVREREGEEGLATGVSEGSSQRTPRVEQARARESRSRDHVHEVACWWRGSEAVRVS
jgi:hypothetical protein